jgi:hypothetical protein
LRNVTAVLEIVRIGPERYEARGPDNVVVWSVELDLRGQGASPFREEAIWADARLAVIGGGECVVLLDLESGTERARIDVPSHFGQLSIQRVDGVEWLFILGWRDVHAFTPDLREQWVMRDVAVDGITGGNAQGPVLHVNAEMDPPGGWFAVQLDLHTGQEIARSPAFTEGYVGIYGAHQPRSGKY